jgi:hypothetical protein
MGIHAWLLKLCNKANFLSPRSGQPLAGAVIPLAPQTPITAGIWFTKRMTAPFNLALQPAGTVTHGQICPSRQSVTVLAYSRCSALSLVDHGGSALRQRLSTPKAASRRIIPRDPLSILCPNHKPQQPSQSEGRPVVTPEGAITATSPAIQPHRLRCDPLCMGRTCKQAAGPGGLRCRIPDRAGDSLVICGYGGSALH